MLKELCVEKKLACHLLVLTDGGKGHCLLEGGCQPTTAAVRDLEMKNSASYFKATLEKSNLEDSPAGSPEGVLSAWNDSIGGGESLMNALVNYLKKVNPDLIFTFDPRHGSSCHLDHRAVGLLVTEAVNRVKGNLNSLFYPQAYWEAGIASSTQVWVANDVIIGKDSKVFLADSSQFWSAIVDVLKIHPSQFSLQKNDYADAFSYAPSNKKVSPLLNAMNLSMTDPLYQNLCPFNDKYWPGQYPKQ